jgi:hypothetical protein
MVTMNWKDNLNKALKALKDMAESESVKNLTAKARQTAAALVQKAKTGALNAAEAFVEANSDPTALKIRYLNAEISIVSPSDGLDITRPQAGTLVISDGAGNGLVINASADKAYVAETLGTVVRLSGNTYDLGPEDGINVLVLKE